MKNDLIKTSEMIKQIDVKKNNVKGHIDLYYKAKNGFMNSYSICGLFILSLSIGSILLTYILPSYVVGYLCLFINCISLSFLIYLISENRNNLRVMEKNRINSLKLELKKYEDEYSFYDNEYKKIVETVMLGDDIQEC